MLTSVFETQINIGIMNEMTEPQAFFNDFVTIHTKLKGKEDSIENTGDCGIKDFFETHLSSSRNHLLESETFGSSVYNIKIGDTIKLRPSNWSVEFSEKHKLNSNNIEDYEVDYIVEEIEVTMYSKNPLVGENIPHMKILITLDRK